LEKNKIIKPGGFMNINVVGITATIKEFLEMPENNSWHKRKLRRIVHVFKKIYF
jgi:hypothetical protein